jgi:DNA-binding MarR family transcriptional regulator
VPGADFRERTVRTTVARQPQTDGTAVAMNLALHRLAATHQYLSEAAIHRPRGWTYSGFRVLYMVWLFEPVQARDLARFAGVSRQTTSTVLGTLESAGLVDRRRGATADRRLVAVRLTDRGRELIESAIQEQNTLERGWFAALSRAEQAEFIAMCDRIMVRMQPSGAGGSVDGPGAGSAAHEERPR